MQAAIVDTPITSNCNFVVNVETPSQETKEKYEKIMGDWSKKITALYHPLNQFDDEDSEIIRASWKVINLLVDKVTLAGEDDLFFAAIEKRSSKVCAFAIAIIYKEQGELSYLATDPDHLRLKDRLQTRIRGAGTAVVQAIASRTHKLHVKATVAAFKFYIKLGFQDVTEPGDKPTLVLITKV